MTLEPTAFSPGMLPVPGSCFLCFSFPCLLSLPRAAGLSFPISPKAGVSLHSAMPTCQTAALPKHHRAAQEPWQLLGFGEVQNPVVQTSFSLSLTVTFSLLPHCSASGHLEVAAKPLSILPELSPSCSWWHKAGSGCKDGAAGEVAKTGGSGVSSVWILMPVVFSL